MISKKILKTPKKYFRMLLTPFQHVFQNFFRITADGDNRITADGDVRITANSDY